MQDLLPDPSFMLTVGALVIDTLAWRVRLNDEPIHLTRLEFKVLVYLAKNSGRVVTKDELLLQVWECSQKKGGTTNQVTCCIKRLRQKLVKRGYAYLRSVRAIGYRLDMGPSSDHESVRVGKLTSNSPGFDLMG